MMTRSSFHLPPGRRVGLQPVDQGLGLAIGALAGLGGEFAELPEQRLFLSGDGRQGLADGADDLAGLGFVFLVVGVVVGEILDVAASAVLAALRPPTVAMCFSSVMPKAAGEEKRRFLSSFRTNSAAMRSPSVAACLGAARNTVAERGGPGAPRRCKAPPDA